MVDKSFSVEDTVFAILGPKYDKLSSPWYTLLMFGIENLESWRKSYVILLLWEISRKMGRDIFVSALNISFARIWR